MHRYTIGCALLLLSLCCVRLPYSSSARAAQPALLVIAGLSFPGTDIKLSDLKSAFRGQRIMLGSKPLIPINHPLESPVRVRFDRKVLGLEPSAVGRFWVDQRIRDEGKPPTTAGTPELAVRVVAALFGTVSYATQDMLNPKIKVLTVDGKSAAQPGYGLAD
jgi:hypothetical protein